MTIFKKAAMTKVRFQTRNGLINVEDLWDLSLTSLDNIAKSLHKALKEAEEVSFITDSGVADAKTTLKFELVKEVIATKIETKKAKENRAAIATAKAKLNDLIEEKEDENLKTLSVEQLKAQIVELEKQ